MDLVTIEIMRELAAMRGERSWDGTWKTNRVGLLEASLIRAIRLQKRVEKKAAEMPDED